LANHRWPTEVLLARTRNLQKNMNDNKRLKIPKYLQPETKKWCRETYERYVLEEHHRRILILAAESWDRKQQARAILEKDGLTVTDKYGATKPHPCLAVEKDAGALFLRSIRELGLDLASEPARPPITQPANWRR
jgi:P27 family predicted phage terminase small subunit